MKLKIFVSLLILTTALYVEYLFFKSVYQQEIDNIQAAQYTCEIFVIKNFNEELEDD
jgi:hypothetical protein